MRKKIYVAGKITGLPWEQVVQKFSEAQREIEALGFEVINPIILVNDPDTGWKDAMIICLRALSKCHGVYFLPCTIDSRGAKIEMHHAILHNLELYSDIKQFNIHYATSNDLPSQRQNERPSISV